MDNTELGDFSSGLSLDRGSSLEREESTLAPTDLDQLSKEEQIRLILQQTAICDNLEAEAEEMRQRLKRMDAQLEQEETLLSQLQAVIAPIRRLPPEILSMIIRTHVQANEEESAWVPLAVCKSWRAATFMIAELWNVVALHRRRCTKGSEKDESKWKSVLGLCTSKEDVERALKYVGSLPLRLEICEDLDAKRVREWLTVIQTVSSAKPKLRSLCVGRIDDALLDLLEGFDLSHLEEIDTDDERILKLVLDGSRKLSSLSTSPAMVSTLDFPYLWPQLDELDLYGDNETTIWPVVAQCTALKTLQIWIPGLDIVEPRLALPQLRRLYLEEFVHLWPIDCANLTYLFINAASNPGLSYDGVISLPHLCELSCGPMRSPAVAQYFDAPQLEYLRLWDEEDDEDGPQSRCTAGLRAVWPDKPQPKRRLEPQVLVLEDGIVSATFLASLLRLRHRCTSINLYDMDILVEDRQDDFFSLLDPSTDGLPCLTSLERMAIDLTGAENLYLPTIRGEALLSGAHNFLQKRSESGRPLRSMCIRPHYGEWVELVST